MVCPITQGDHKKVASLISA